MLVMILCGIVVDGRTKHIDCYWCRRIPERSPIAELGGSSDDVFAWKNFQSQFYSRRGYNAVS